MRKVLILIILALIDGSVVLSDGQRDHGEPCSLRSQVANLFRTQDSPEGCISAKGLICISHKCTCGDPSDVYETPEPEESSTSLSGVAKQAATGIIGKLFGKGGSTSSTVAPPSATGGTGSTTTAITGGRCLGRVGSPCFRTNSTCIAHAACEPSGFGSISVCKCQGIYSSNTSGRCSKTATAIQQALKFGTGGITG